MKTGVIWIFINFIGLTIDYAHLKPVPDLQSYPEGCVHSEQNSRFARAPDDPGSGPGEAETAAPGSKEKREAQAPEPGQGDHDGGDTSAFALGDTVNDFFRSQKGRDIQSLPPVKHGQEHTAQWGKDDQLKVGLPADEQAACYEQQNIDPPRGIGEAPPRPMLRLKDQRPFSGSYPIEPRAVERPLFKEREREKKRMHSKEEDDDIITSLYSDPERRSKSKKQRLLEPQSETELGLNPHHSVYKPVGVRPEFPVYDEDIDFHPDPLQGILEDKYWLDPQEQEAVIRKYIDLANNNMQPARGELEKRSMHREYEPKSVDSMEAFRDAEVVDRECPCREMVACGDCSRGKYKKKSNSSEDDGREKFDRRKLLSVDYNSENDAEILTQNVEPNKDSVGRPAVNREEESQVEGEIPSFTSNYFGRKLLSLEEDEDAEDYVEDYVEDGEYKTTDRIEESVLDDDDENAAPKSYYRRSVDLNENTGIENTPDEKYYHSPTIVNASSNEASEFQFESKTIRPENKYVNVKPTEEFIEMQKPFLEKTDTMAKFYVPNRIGNLVQKALLKEKTRHKSTTADPDVEFRINRNKTYVNVSIAMNDINISVTTEMADEARIVKKHVREQPVHLPSKGRRSYHLPPLLRKSNVVQSKNVNAKKVQMQGDDPGTTMVAANPSVPQGNSSDNATVDATPSPDNSTASTLTTNLTTTVNVTSSTVKGTTKKTKKDENAEDTIDAEIANDIVETVIAESQAGSVVGHNLGLCRRNESVSKYGRVSSESEQLLRKVTIKSYNCITVTACILDHIRDRLEGQSCTLLDEELLQFLKWMVLSGESYRDYMARWKPEFGKFKAEVKDDIPIPTETVEVKVTTVRSHVSHHHTSSSEATTL